MNKYYENAEGQLFVDPIVANHVGLTEITQEQFNHFRLVTMLDVLRFRISQKPKAG